MIYELYECTIHKRMGGGDYTQNTATCANVLLSNSRGYTSIGY